jgi:site-specific DNA recombinase
MKACIYARYSTDNQTHDTIEVQVEKCAMYAKEHSIEIVEVFADEAVSGMKSERPELDKLFFAANLHAFDCVLIYDQSRFSRDIVDWFTFRRTMQNNGIQIISVTQPFVGGDLNDTAVFATEGINALVNQLHVLQTRQKVVDAMNHIAQQALHTGGNPPLGYDIDSNKHYVINEYEAEIVRLIFTMYGEGQSYKNIIVVLNSKSYKTKANKPFGTNSLSTILRNERYVGTYIFNKIPQKHCGKRNSHAVNPNAIRIENAMPAIISKELWQAVQARLKNNVHNAANKAKVEYLLSGKVYCGKCGCAMVGQTSKYVYHFYICSGKARLKTCDKKNIQKDLLENHVINFVKLTLACAEDREKKARLIYETEQRMQGSVNPAAKSVKARIAEVNKKIANINEAISQGVWSTSTADMLKQLESQQQNLYCELASIEKLNVISKHTYEEILSSLNHIYDINTDDIEGKRLLMAFVQKVVVFDDKVRIVLMPIGDKSSVKTEIPSTEDFSTIDGTHMVGAGDAVPSVCVPADKMLILIDTILKR